MIRKINIKDVNSVAEYLSKKLNISFLEASIKASKIAKSGNISFLKDEKDISGLCWIESKIVKEKKERYIEIYVNNWRLAEEFLQCLRWTINGIYYFSLPKHDTLNRTLNKAGMRFFKVEGDKNIYVYKFEKRNFISYKSEDNEV